MPMAIVSSAGTPDPHTIIAYDVNDCSKGGEIRCPVEGCSYFHSLSFDFKTAP